VTWVAQESGISNTFSGLNFFGVDFSSTDVGTLVGEEGIILRTTDGGASWVSQTSQTNDWLYAVDCTDDNNGTAIGFLFGTIIHTTDGGQSWVTQDSGTTEGLLGIDFTDANTGTVVGGAGTILHTSDGGQSWVPQVSGTSNQLRAVSFSDAETGAVVGELGTILRTTDGGATWVPQNSGVTETLLGVTFTDANNGTAVGQIGVILKTTDGGQTWSRQESGTNQDLYNVAFTGPDTGTVVGGFGAILRTSASAGGSCPEALTYWRANPDSWPVDTLTLGSQSYDKTELLELVNTPSRNDAPVDVSLALAHQLIAARLNVAQGSDPTPIASGLEHADTLLSKYPGKLPYGVERASTAGHIMHRNATLLSDYNHGTMTSGCSP
jgi:photosystem II stability/assembly factor-like uncharacterized protein